MRTVWGAICLALIGRFDPTSAQWNTTAAPGENFTETTMAVTTTGLPCLELQPPFKVRSYPTRNSIKIDWIWNNTANCKNVSLEAICTSEKDEGNDTTHVTANTVVSTIISNLSEFTNYICTGKVYNNFVSSENSSEYNITTLEGVPPIPILSINNISSTNFEVTWEFSEVPGILLYSIVKIKTISPNHNVPLNCTEQQEIINNIKGLYYFFNDALPDYKYDISVFGVTSAGNGTENSTEIVTKSSAPSQPQNVRAYSFETSDNGTDIQINATISWEMPCKPNGAITKYFIIVNGWYTENTSITDYRNLQINAGNNQTNYNFVIDEIMPSSVYYFRVNAETDDYMGDFENVTITTEDNYPGEPVIEAMNTSATNIKISWSEPLKNSGEITNYTILFISNGPDFIKKTNCNYTYLNITLDFDADKTEYDFEDLDPFFNYSLSIYAATSRGFGPNTTLEIRTNSSEPEKPENLSYNLTDFSSNFDYNQSVTLHWSIPCRSNGFIEKFEVNLYGSYSENENIVDNRTLETETNDEIDYKFEVNNLNASFLYKYEIRAVLDDGKKGEQDFYSFLTPVGYPGKAHFTNFSYGNYIEFMQMNWEEPSEIRGKILDYRLNITSLGPQIVYNNECTYSLKDFSFIKVDNEMKFDGSYPFFRYIVSVEARTEKGFGPEVIKNMTTPSIEPDKVKIVFKPESILSSDDIEEYNACLNISFILPCFTNGKIENIELKYTAIRNDYPLILFSTNFSEFNAITPYNFTLQPEYDYDLTVTLENSVGNSTADITFKSPAGVPTMTENFTQFATPKIEGVSEAKLTLREEFFTNTNGDVKYLALIVSSENITGGEFSRWNGVDWPIPDSSARVYYQINEKFWYPFTGNNSEVSVVIGNDTNCKKEDLFCNKPLEEDTQYYLLIRIFTEDYYKNSEAIGFKTGYTSRLGLILGLIFGLLGLALIGFFLFYAWKKKLYLLTSKVLQRNSTVQEVPEVLSGTSVPLSKFVSYCKILDETPEKVREQYKLLNEQSNESCAVFTTVYALLPENKRKNRYTNILPYDDTRVKLLIDEDDEISSDYINASYIKGYSGNIEYIATQGPMLSTCKDFWKMIIQEKVRIIVMVSQFIEDSKEKCYKYFPNNHENMLIDDNIEVRCSTELHFGTYCVRTLQIKKDLKQETVTHMQFLDWPDFGVPTGTENMLQFCYQLREKLNVEGGVAVVHCSAGVGRTGTLIATDILLQVIKSGRNIDVFKTVLELRMQRKNMVQTDKQYMYIHKLLRDNMDHPVSSEHELHSEPLYENLAVFKKSEGNLYIVKDIESKL